MECLNNGDAYGGAARTIITNCAKALFFLTDNVVICVACKKGFYPTRETASNGAKITACTAFVGSKCTDSNNDNICTTCAADYYHPYDSTTKKINYESDCINPVVVDECHAMTSAGACA